MLCNYCTLPHVLSVHNIGMHESSCNNNICICGMYIYMYSSSRKGSISHCLAEVAIREQPVSSQSVDLYGDISIVVLMCPKSYLGEPELVMVTP